MLNCKSNETSMGRLGAKFENWMGDYKVIWRSGSYRPKKVIYLALWRKDDATIVQHAFGVDDMVYDNNGFAMFDELSSGTMSADLLELLNNLTQSERNNAQSHLNDWLVDIYPKLKRGEVKVPIDPIHQLAKMNHDDLGYPAVVTAADRARHLGLDWAN